MPNKSTKSKRNRASKRPKSVISLEVGKTYLTRDHRKVHIVKLDKQGIADEYPYRGVYAGSACGDYWKRDGRFSLLSKHDADLILEHKESDGPHFPEIKVGQKWRMRNGRHAVIVSIDKSDTHPVNVTFSSDDGTEEWEDAVSLTGCSHWDGVTEHKFDLVELIACPEDTPAKPVPEGIVFGLSPADPLTRQEGGSHYKDMKIQPFEYTHANNLPWAEGEVVKYVSRWRNKNGIADLKKARHVLDLLISEEEKKAK